MTSRVTPLRDISCRPTSRVLVCTARALGLYTVTPPSKHKATQLMLSTKAFNQCCFNVGQCRRSCANIETVLGECLVFAGKTASYFYRSVEIRCSLPTVPAQKTQGITSSCICIPASVSMQIQSCYNYVFIIFCLYSLST